MNTDEIRINGQILHSDEIQKKLKTENHTDWEKGIYHFILNWFDASDFILQQTSGSTGVPKEIRLKKSTMMASAQKTIDFFQLKPNNTAWLCLPIDYIAGKMMVVRAIVGQLNLIISEPKGIPQIPAQVVDFTAMVPLQVQKLLEAKTNFHSIRQLIIGGASTNNSLLMNIQQVPSEVYATYGMTETCSHIALQRLNGPNPDKHFKILAGISISINEENCLVIHYPEIAANPIETNDVAELLSEEEFIIRGRADNVINSGGIKISPETLEKEISEFIMRDCLIIPLEDDLLGQKMVLVLEKNNEVANNEELLQKIKNIAGKHRTPTSVYYLDEFPRNASMKIDRKEVMKQIVQPKNE